MVKKYERFTVKERLNPMTPVKERDEHEEDVYCPKCCQIETLTFMGTKLASGRQKWTQLSNGRVVHTCNGKYISLNI